MSRLVDMIHSVSINGLSSISSWLTPTQFRPESRRRAEDVCPRAPAKPREIPEAGSDSTVDTPYRGRPLDFATPNRTAEESSFFSEIDSKIERVIEEEEEEEGEDADTVANSRCHICLSRKVRPANLDSCSHEFCFGCIRNWSKRVNTCPMCRATFNEITRGGSREGIDLLLRRYPVREVHNESTISLQPIVWTPNSSSAPAGDPSLVESSFHFQVSSPGEAFDWSFRETPSGRFASTPFRAPAPGAPWGRRFSTPHSERFAVPDALATPTSFARGPLTYHLTPTQSVASPELLTRSRQSESEFYNSTR